MKMNKYYIALFAFTLSLSSFAMEKDSFTSAKKRSRLTLSQDGEVRSDLTTDEFVEQLKRDINNIDFTSLEEHVQNPELCKSLNKDQRSDLVSLAKIKGDQLSSSRKHLGRIFAGMNSLSPDWGLTKDSCEDPILQSISLFLSAPDREKWLEEKLSNTKQIYHLIVALENLKHFRFPQSHFSPDPYSPITPTLDQVIISFIANEKSGIKISCFHLTFFPIAQSLVDKKMEDVTVDVLTNQDQGSEPHAPYHALNYLVSHGISVGWPKPSRYQMNHNKYIIFESNLLGKKLVLTGSCNLTSYSFKKSWENLMVVDDPETIEQFEQKFGELRKFCRSTSLRELKGKQREEPLCKDYYGIPDGKYADNGAYIPRS